MTSPCLVLPLCTNHLVCLSTCRPSCIAFWLNLLLMRFLNFTRSVRLAGRAFHVGIVRGKKKVLVASVFNLADDVEGQFMRVAGS